MPSEAPMSINASQSSMRTYSQQLRCFMELRCDTLYLDYCKVPSAPFLFKLKTSSLQASFKLAQMHIFKVSWDFSLTLSQFGSTWPGRIGAGERCCIECLRHGGRQQGGDSLRRRYISMPNSNTHPRPRHHEEDNKRELTKHN